MKFDTEIQYEPVLQLDEDITVALKKLGQIEAISHMFSGLDALPAARPVVRRLRKTWFAAIIRRTPAYSC